MPGIKSEQSPQTPTDAPATEPTGRAKWASQDTLLSEYYDTEWGMPVIDEQGTYERLTLESFQAGLSWLTILRRREAFRAAFAQFDVDTVAAFDESDVERLMGDSSIIRNRKKIEAAITNARATIALRETGIDLARLVWSYQPDRSPAPLNDSEVPPTSEEAKLLSKDLKSRGFTFVGPTIVYSLMTAIGIVDVHLVTSPRRGCSGLWNIDGSRAGAPAHMSRR